ncbi:MAG: hypothetical protein HRF50_18215 [Phycisphaerae bacterium]
MASKDGSHWRSSSGSMVMRPQRRSRNDDSPARTLRLVEREVEPKKLQFHVEHLILRLRRERDVRLLQADRIVRLLPAVVRQLLQAQDRRAEDLGELLLDLLHALGVHLDLALLRRVCEHDLERRPPRAPAELAAVVVAEFGRGDVLGVCEKAVPLRVVPLVTSTWQ